MDQKVVMDEVMYKHFVKAINPERLELRLFATEKCNFRCTYCYEDFELGRMEPWVRNGIKSLIEKRCQAGLKSLFISWFGGEPLLAMEVIEDIESFRREMLKKYPQMYPEKSGITTNGYLLTPDVLARLVDLNVTSYQISIDGSELQHNKTRLRADGAGTYEKIMENLLAAAKTDLDFHITLRMHLHEDNIEDVMDVLSPIMNENFARDRRFVLHPISVGNYGGAYEKNNIKGTSRKTAAEVRNIVLDRFNAIRNEGKAPQITAAPASGTASEGLDTVCYAAAANSFGIRSDGNLVKCTTALHDDKNKIGRITESGELEIDSALVKLWMGGFLSGKAGELSCPLHMVKKLDNPNGKKVISITALAA